MAEFIETTPPQHPPSVWRVALTQFGSSLGSGVFLLTFGFLCNSIWGIISIFIARSLPDQFLLVGPFLDGFVILGLFLTTNALLAWLQELSLNRWISNSNKWRVYSTIVPVFLWLGMVPLASVIISSIGGVMSSATRVVLSNNALVDELGRMAVRWGAFSGALIGLAGGLVFGLVQSFWLISGKRRWWIATSILWALIWAGLLVWFCYDATVPWFYFD